MNENDKKNEKVNKIKQSNAGQCNACRITASLYIKMNTCLYDANDLSNRLSDCNQTFRKCRGHAPDGLCDISKKIAR